MATVGEELVTEAWNRETVLVFDTQVLENLGSFQGLSVDVERYLSVILEEENSRFVSRKQAEDDPSLKQLIPYVIFRCGDQVFHYIRGKEAGESRLRAKGSIGIGGHIQPQDVNLFSSPRTFYLTAAAREVAEEVRVGAEYQERIVALINDDSTPVGRVHFGIVHIWDLDKPSVYKRERQITRAAFVPVDQLWSQRNTLETWSQLCLGILT
jgi:predicted NUDIX family phosphoesterase